MTEKIASMKPGPTGCVDLERRKALEDRKLKEACCDFEAILLSQVFKAMRSNPLAVESSDPGREMYEGMMDQSLASDISRGNRTGLAEILYRQLSPQGTGKPSDEEV